MHTLEQSWLNNKKNKFTALSLHVLLKESDAHIHLCFFKKKKKKKKKHRYHFINYNTLSLLERRIFIY